MKIIPLCVIISLISFRPDHQRLMFSSTELKDAKMISDYNIFENSRIDVIPLYPKVKIEKDATQNVKDFIAFNSNCEEWMTKSLVSNGSLIEEKDKLKSFSYNLTKRMFQITK